MKMVGLQGGQELDWVRLMAMMGEAQQANVTFLAKDHHAAACLISRCDYEYREDLCCFAPA